MSERSPKTYGGCFDGRHRVIVAAKSKKEAVASLNRHGVHVSVHQFNNYGAETGNSEECETALVEPGTVYRRSVSRREPFQKLAEKDGSKHGSRYQNESVSPSDIGYIDLQNTDPALSPQGVTRK